LGNGDGTFGPLNNFPTGNSPYAIAVGDFNDDRVLDLVTANESSNSNSVSILLGNGDGTFSTTNNFPTGEESLPTFVAVGDFNDDDVLDLVTVYDSLGQTNSNSITILLGNGDGTFNTANSFPVGDRPFSVAVGNFN
jgi:hypothetical protein